MWSLLTPLLITEEWTISWTHPYLDQGHTHSVLGLSPCGELSFPLSDSVHLCSAQARMLCGTWPTPILFLSLQGGDGGPSVATHSCSVPAAGRDLLASGDQHPLLKLILLCLFSVKGKALFQPVLDCVMFSLATMIPICRGQKCSDF